MKKVLNSLMPIERFFSKIPAAVYIKNADMEYTAGNEAFLALTGIEAEDLCGKTDHDLFPWDRAEQYRLDDLEVMIKERAKTNIERMFVRKDGSTSWISFSAYPLPDENGRTIGMAGFGVDISRRKLLEQRLTAVTGCMLNFRPNAEENIRLLLKTAGEVFGADAVLFFPGKAGEKGGALVSWGTAPGGITVPEDVLPLKTKVWELKDHEVECFSPYVPPGGHPGLSGAAAFLAKGVRFGGNVIGLLTLFLPVPFTPDSKDIEFLEIAASAVAIENQRRETDEQLREAMQQASQANRAKSDFLARVSHELRTPLNGVLGRLQLLFRAQELSESASRNLRIIGTHASDLLELIDDLLDIARIEREEYPVETAPFSLPELLQEVIEHFIPLAEEKGLEFESLSAECLKDISTAVLGDRRIMKHILLNLTGNAVKFTGSGQVSVRIRRRGERYRFSIHDTGAGFPSEKMREIFMPFARIGGTARDVQGTGLGLHIARTLLKLLDSDIRVKSILGAGSVFWFTLRLPEHKQTAVPRAEAGPAVHGPLRRHPAPAEIPFPAKIPPAGPIRKLYRAARIGDVGEVRKELESEENGLTDFPDFTAYVGHLCGMFAIEKLTSFLVECLPED